MIKDAIYARDVDADVLAELDGLAIEAADLYGSAKGKMDPSPTGFEPVHGTSSAQAVGDRVAHFQW